MFFKFMDLTNPADMRLAAASYASIIDRTK
jgi:hypothetical protein